MIISGGVNIYPQEAENLLAVHPKIAGLPRHPTGKLLKRMLRDEYARAFAQNEQEVSDDPHRD